MGATEYHHVKGKSSNKILMYNMITLIFHCPFLFSLAKKDQHVEFRFLQWS